MGYLEYDNIKINVNVAQNINLFTDRYRYKTKYGKNTHPTSR